MKRRILVLALSFCALNTYAQVPEDALRMSWNNSSGTARSQAIGGAIGALGGDISTTFVNPAGLAFYKTSEVVFTPGINISNYKTDFRGTSSSGSGKSKFLLGTSGAVFSFNDPYSNWNTKVFSVGLNRTADFNSTIKYKGFNNMSSYSEQFLEEAAYNGLDNESIYDYPFTSAMAFYTYLIDEVIDNGNFIGFSGLPNISTGLNQEKTMISRGGITELALSFAANKMDKVYFGGSLGIPIVNYKRTTIFRESDASGDTDNDFNYSEFTQNYSSKGAGFNLKLGLIFKPVNALRIGVGIHTPTFYGLSENSSASMITDTENYGPNSGVNFVTSDTLNNGRDAYFKYNLVSPWKFLISGAYIFGQDENVRNQKGFLSADLEYVTLGSSRFSSVQSEYDNSEDAYYDGVNDATKQSYKGAFNLRVGGELKFNVLMVRAGFGYFGNPYEDKELKANRTNISGGLGYRNKGIFVDLTYNHQIRKDVDFPYRLADVANTYSTINAINSNALLTFGFKF